MLAALLLPFVLPGKTASAAAFGVFVLAIVVAIVGPTFGCEALGSEVPTLWLPSGRISRD